MPLNPFMLASGPDISSVPADFVKNFLLTLGFLAGLYFAYRKGQKVNGTKDEPINIAQPLEIKKQANYAHKKDLEKLQKTVVDAQAAGEERRVDILKAIHESERRMVVEVKELHVRLNPVSEGFSAHQALLEAMGGRLDRSERAHQDFMLKIQSRIDDAIRIAAKNHAS